jgi:hypothetical protein
MASIKHIDSLFILRLLFYKFSKIIILYLSIETVNGKYEKISPIIPHGDAGFGIGSDVKR